MTRPYIIRFSETVNYVVTVQAEGPQTAVDEARRIFADGEYVREESATLSHHIVSEPTNHSPT